MKIDNYSPQYKRFFFFLFLFFSVNLGILAQQTLSGIVVDKEGEPLIGASLLAGQTGTVTDALGEFSIDLPEGAYSLEIRYLGFQTQTVEGFLAAGEKATLTIQLKEENQLLSTATITSNKFEKSLGEVTVSMEVIKPDFISNNNANSLDEAVDKISGVQIIDRQANIRGGSGFSYGAGSRVLLMLDNIPLLQTDAGYSNWNDLPTELISQVEIVKGASSALYGSYALNGIINLRTKEPGIDPEIDFFMADQFYSKPQNVDSIWWASSDTIPHKFTTAFSYSQKIDKSDIVASFFFNSENSFNQSTTNDYGRMFLKYGYRFSDALKLDVSANLNFGNSSSFFYWKNYPQNHYEPNANALSATTKLRYNVDPKLTYFDKGGNRHKFMGRYYFVDNENLNNQSNQSKLLYGEYQFQRSIESWNMDLTAGLVGTATDVSAELYGDTTYQSSNLAGYLQLDKKLGNRLNVSAGLRWEQNVLKNPGFTYILGLDTVTIAPSKDKEVKPVARLGLNYRAADFTYLRASIGQAYRYPTIAEKYVFTDIGGANVIPSPELTSETSWSAEFGIKQGFALGSWKGFLDAAFFWSRYNDMMEFSVTKIGVPTAFQSINVGDTRIYGMETSIQAQAKVGDFTNTLILGYTFIDPIFLEFDTTSISSLDEATTGQLNAFNSTSDENVLKYRFRHSIKGDIQFAWKNWSIGASGFYLSEMEAIDYIFQALIVPGLGEYREDNTGGISVLNLRMGYDFDFGLGLRFLVNNVFNKAYSFRPGLMEAPRSVGLRINYDFFVKNK